MQACAIQPFTGTASARVAMPPHSDAIQMLAASKHPFILDMKVLPMKSLLGSAVIALALVAAPAAFAQAQEQDYARACVQQGKCLTLDRVIGIVQARVPGKFIGNEIDDAQARLGVIIYRLTFMKDNGEVTRVDVDAKSGRIISME